MDGFEAFFKSNKDLKYGTAKSKDILVLYFRKWRIHITDVQTVY